MRIRALSFLAILTLAVAPMLASGAPRIPNTVLVLGGNIDDIVSLDPAHAFEFSSVWLVEQMYDTLVRFSKEFNRVQPELAESWTVSNEGKTYTFRLRRGVRFHSGAAVDARAVEFSIRRAFNLKLTPSFIITSFITRAEDVVAVGSDQVRVVFKQTMPEILMASVLANAVTAVVDPALVQRNAAADDPLANKWLTNHDAGSGPFQLLGWTRNIKVELQAFDGYWGGRAKLNRVFIQQFSEPAPAMLALQRGDVDALLAGTLLPSQYKQLEGQAGIVLRRTPTFQVRYLAMNVNYEPLSKKEVRNAIKWAIDYEAIKRIYEDAIDTGQTVVPARMFGHHADRPYRRDVTRARTLMREGGFERGFKAEMLVPNDPPLPDLAAKIKEDLAQIGIEVDVKVLRNADLLAVYRAQRHQLVIQRWGADYPDPDNLAKAFSDFDARQLAWRNVWDNPVKRQVNQAVVELDRAKREAMYRDIQRTTLEEGPYVIIGYPIETIAMRANVKGLEPSPLFSAADLIDVVKE